MSIKFKFVRNKSTHSRILETEQTIYPNFKIKESSSHGCHSTIHKAIHFLNRYDNANLISQSKLKISIREEQVLFSTSRVSEEKRNLKFIEMRKTKEI